ncbi:vesicle coat protein [Hypoxylon cercidicola]|nr:vesicle coat protein [Hypoxylon cercidicola]
MTSILCLAHYCDLHGPTPLMVTEGLPVPCGQCCDDNTELLRPQTSAATHGPQAAVTDALRKMTLGAPRSSSTPVSDQEAQTHRASLLRAAKNGSGSTVPSVTAASPTTASAIQTPPQSPRNAPESFPDANGKAGLRRDSSFRRTYDDYVTKRANPCQNCALTLPKRQDPKNGKDQSTAGTTDSKSDLRGPTLRTRAPYARVYGGNGEISPPNSNPQSSYASDAEEDVVPRGSNRSNSRRRPTTSTSHSSISSRSSVTQHTHYLDYTSTHEPVVPNTYSIVRASCLRTLSFETLPRRPETAQSNQSFSSPPGIPPSFQYPISHGPGFITTAPNPQSAANGGPIFFGDPLAGYTTAYIFRIPDVHARGRKRVYAFLALSTHRERLAMKTFSFISAAFRDLANWIQELAEAEAEREREREEANSPVAALNAAYGYGGIGDTSSFLTGGGRGGFVQRMGGSMGPGGFAPKARGLAELVGLPDFFIELHSRFVQLLLELGVVLSS